MAEQKSLQPLTKCARNNRSGLDTKMWIACIYMYHSNGDALAAGRSSNVPVMHYTGCGGDGYV